MSEDYVSRGSLPILITGISKNTGTMSKLKDRIEEIYRHSSADKLTLGMVQGVLRSKGIVATQRQISEVRQNLAEEDRMSLPEDADEEDQRTTGK